MRFPQAWIARSNYFRFRDSRHLGPSRRDVDGENIPYPMIVVMNCSFRKEEILNRVGLVSEEFNRYGGEDYEFGYRVARAGLKIRFAPEALVEHHEHGGSIRQYMKKLYITSRDSLPVLYRLAPGAHDSSLSRLLEAPTASEGWVRRLGQSLVKGLLNDSCVRLAEVVLDATDGLRWAYSPILFRYAFAGAMLRGIRDREPATGNGPLVRQASGGGWFE